VKEVCCCSFVIFFHLILNISMKVPGLDHMFQTPPDSLDLYTQIFMYMGYTFYAYIL
jgi:hypothetical protein